MTWMLLIGAGLVLETVVIVALGSRVTARYDAEKCAPLPAAGDRSRLPDGDPRVPAGPMDTPSDVRDIPGR